MKHKKGSTLIETVLYIFLLTSFLLIVTQLVISVLDLTRESSGASLTKQDAMFIIQKLTNDLSTADAIQYPVNPGDNTASLILDRGGHIYTYQLTGSDLVYDDGTISGKLNGYATDISYFNVLRIGESFGAGAVRIDIETTALTEESGGARTDNYNFTAQLR